MSLLMKYSISSSLMQKKYHEGHEDIEGKECP